MAQVVERGAHGNGYARPTALTGPVIEKICAARLFATLSVDQTDRDDSPYGGALQEIDRFCALTDQAMRSVLAQGRKSPRWADLVDSLIEWLSVCGHILDTADPVFSRLVREFAVVEKETTTRIRARNEGDACKTPPAPAYGLPTLSAFTNDFRTFKGQNCKTPHVDACINAWDLLIEHCGDLKFDEVTPGHIFEFLHVRMRASNKPWAAKRALGFDKSVLREAFGLARTSGLMTAPNPVDAMEVDPSLPKEEEAKHKKPRYPFTGKQLTRLFASSWYDPANSSDFRGQMPVCGSGRQLRDAEFRATNGPDGSASDRRVRDLTAAQLTPAPRGQTADYHGWHWPASCGPSKPGCDGRRAAQ